MAASAPDNEGIGAKVRRSSPLGQAPSCLVLPVGADHEDMDDVAQNTTAQV